MLYAKNLIKKRKEKKPNIFVRFLGESFISNSILIQENNY